MSNRSKWLLGATAVPVAVVTITVLYVAIGGHLLGLNVSSLNDGPTWPFAVVWFGTIIAVLLGVAWLISFLVDRSLSINSDSGKR